MNFLLSILILFSFESIYSAYKQALKSNYRIQPKGDIPEIFINSPIIENIFIEGLVYVSKNALLSKFSIEKGKNLEAKSIAKVTKNIFNLGYFSDVKLEYEYFSDKNIVDLYIVVKEKQKVSEIIINGNDHLSKDAINKKVNIEKIFWIDQQNAKGICEKIRKLYAEKQYHKAEVFYSFVPLENGSVNFIIDIKEGIFGRVRCIKFSGNKDISRNQLKDIIASREYWLLGFLDRGGVFRREMVDFDRYQIETYYQSNGYFEARVKSVELKEDEYGFIDIDFNISEGPLYRFGKISIPNDPDITYYTMKKIISIDKGEVYSREKVKNIMLDLKDSLGESGYMYANVNPKMKIDKENNLIDVEFIIQKGKPIYVRNINIFGNDKTHEKNIRREILINEGSLLTSKKLEKSKRAVESLGFFTPNTGVNWNLKTLNKYQADLDLILEEAKTGKFYLNMGINSGSDAGKRFQSLDAAQNEPRWYDTLLTTSKIGLTLQNTNFAGRGIKYYIDSSYANVDKSLSCGMSTNWIFDLPVSAGWNLSFRNVVYDDFKLSINIPNERNQGANLQFGFRSYILDMTIFGFGLGVDNIRYVSPIIPRIQFPDNLSYQAAYSEMVRRSFEPGTITWATFSISNDNRNHPYRASEGYQWLIDTKLAFPNKGINNEGNFGYFRAGIDGKWYTPLIKEYNIVFYAHGYGGLVMQMPYCNVPYKELFHVGGQNSVRGYLFGQIGPTLFGSSIGATKAFYVNAEIQCPINISSGMMIVAFYDGGAAWDTMFNNTDIKDSTNGLSSIFDDFIPPEKLIQSNSFKYRHSVGLGIRLTAPMPIKIDWGFKLDQNKKAGEPLYEVHISMEGSY